jgi:hypothetical protein
MAAEVAKRLELDPMRALGLLQGMEMLATYAQAEVNPSRDVVQEERESVQMALQSVRPVLQARVQQRLDQLDEQYPEARCLGCRQWLESQGRRDRAWVSTTGELRLWRRYGWCQRCEQGRAIAQEKIGLTESDYTPGLEEVCTLMATTVPHEMAVGLIQQLLGIQISEKASKSMIERRGQQVRQQMDEEAQQIKDYEERWGVRPSVGPAPMTPVVEVAYLEMDGVMVPTRQEVETAQTPVLGRGGKGRRYEVKGREVKNAVLYNGAQCAQESESRGCLLEKTYVSHLGDWRVLAMLVWAQMVKLGFDRATLLVVLSDGAQWIRDLCAWLSIPVLFILDLYHVKHRVWEVAAALYGEGTAQATAWAQQQCQRIEDGQAPEVIQFLSQMKKSHRKARDKLAELQVYLSHNLDRMDYPRYRAMGLRVGSGAVESTNYHVTGARLKLPGMRWSEEGAAVMARLRADLFNGHWQQRTRQFLKAA